MSKKVSDSSRKEKIAEFIDGKSKKELAEFVVYSQSVVNEQDDFDVFEYIPEKKKFSVLCKVAAIKEREHGNDWSLGKDFAMTEKWISQLTPDEQIKILLILSPKDLAMFVDNYEKEFSQVLEKIPENERFSVLCKVAAGKARENGHDWSLAKDFAMTEKWISQLTPDEQIKILPILSPKDLAAYIIKNDRFDIIEHNVSEHKFSTNSITKKKRDIKYGSVMAEIAAAMHKDGRYEECNEKIVKIFDSLASRFSKETMQEVYKDFLTHCPTEENDIIRNQRDVVGLQFNADVTNKVLESKVNELNDIFEKTNTIVNIFLNMKDCNDFFKEALIVNKAKYIVSSNQNGTKSKVSSALSYCKDMVGDIIPITKSIISAEQVLNAFSYAHWSSPSIILKQITKIDKLPKDHVLVRAIALRYIFDIGEDEFCNFWV